jgi:hypothetical protein
MAELGDQIGGGLIFDERHAHDAPAPPFDIIGPDDVLPLIVGPFDEHVGPELADQGERRVVVEQHDTIRGGQRGDESRPLLFRYHRSIGALAEPPDRRVAVDSDDQGRALGAGGFQQRDVAGMEQIEYAVGEDEPGPPLLLAPARGFVGRADLRGGVQSGCVALGWNEKV